MNGEDAAYFRWRSLAHRMPEAQAHAVWVFMNSRFLGRLIWRRR